MNSLVLTLDARGEGLSDSDRRKLADRWITVELAVAAGIRRVDSMTGADLVGRRNNGSYEGLAFPYLLPGDSRVREWRLRRDRPEIEHSHGRQRERNKYLWPPRAHNMIYFPPEICADSLKATALPLIITEGEFKTLALWRLANYNSTSPRFLPVGVPGVWNWRGTIGKEPGPNGERLDVKGVVPDLDLIAVEERRVIIAYDADAADNEQVEIARSHLAREMRMRGARVAILTWDCSQGKGIDDLLANVGPERVLTLLEGVDYEADEPLGKVTADKLADAITKDHYFARDAGGRLYIYRNGCYCPDAASFIAQLVKKLLARANLSFKWSSRKSDEVLRYITVDAPLLWDKPPRDRINVLNGLLDLNTRSLLAHSPEFLSPVQLPIKFDAAARCPAWDRFISEVFPPDSEALAWEIPAWLMTPDTSIQKAILLMGDGANGKSRYLRGVMAFLGRHNTAGLSLHKLENDRFAVARLFGKLANICPDLPSTDLTNTSVFKAITGGDAITAEYKFKDSFEFAPYARLIFSANQPPKSQDGSPAFFRRWLVVPFERTFAAGAPGTLPSDKLDALLSDPEELSGVLNKALEALASIRERGFSESASTLRATNEFRQTTDPLAVWLDERTVLDPQGVTPQRVLRAEYDRACSDSGRPLPTKTAFGLALKVFRPTVASLQRVVNGDKCWCYLGISLVEK